MDTDGLSPARSGDGPALQCEERTSSTGEDVPNLEILATSIHAAVLSGPGDRLEPTFTAHLRPTGFVLRPGNTKSLKV